MEFEIIRSQRKTLAAQIKDGRLLIRVPFTATDQEIHLFMQKHRRWMETHLAKARAQRETACRFGALSPAEMQQLAQDARQLFPARVAYYASKMGVTYGKITIRTQRSRWGSCSSRGNLSFNCLLMLTPQEVIDSVVVHELCHRREMNHSPRFYQQVLQVYPDYYTWDRWLKENGAVLMQRYEMEYVQEK